MSEDGRFAVVAIALVGSPFSPAYARSGGDPLRHCALNVALYGPRASVWSLTERRIDPAHRCADGIALGESSMRWQGDALVIDVDERRAPIGRRLRGRIRLTPEDVTDSCVALDPAHSWWPVAPRARIEVDLDGVSFRGHGYHDANAGDAALPSAFARWSWSRARMRRGAFLAFDVVRPSGAVDERAFVETQGRIEPIESLPCQPLAQTRWGLRRSVRGDRARLVRRLEDTPFYARDLVASRVLGEDVTMMHETMSCERLAAPWVRFLLSFRTRRA